MSGGLGSPPPPPREFQQLRKTFCRLLLIFPCRKPMPIQLRSQRPRQREASACRRPARQGRGRGASSDGRRASVHSVRRIQGRQQRSRAAQLDSSLLSCRNQTCEGMAKLVLESETELRTPEHHHLLHAAQPQIETYGKFQGRVLTHDERNQLAKAPRVAGPRHDHMAMIATRGRPAQYAELPHTSAPCICADLDSGLLRRFLSLRAPQVTASRGSRPSSFGQETKPFPTPLLSLCRNRST